MKKEEQGRKEEAKIPGFQVLDRECIWMKAGVVNFRMCDNLYDCYTCGFDKGMRKTMSKESVSPSKRPEPGWAPGLRERDGVAYCRHYLTGKVSASKVCTRNYECFHCAYDQMLYETDLNLPASAPTYSVVSGYRLAREYSYHKGHCWARFEHGGLVRVGFDDFLARVFGSSTEVTLPSLGEKVTQNKVGWTFTRDEYKAAALSPVSGRVLAVNHKVQKDPGISHEDPYHEGWLLMLEPQMPKRNLKRLYSGVESFRWMEKEVKTLLGLIGPEYEQLSATGGEAIDDLFGHYPEIGWDRLVKTFLRTEKI